MSRERAAIVIACGVVVVPRILRWGQVPAVVDGDELAFLASGIAEYADRSPLWSFKSNSLPAAHFWLMGLAATLFGPDVWSARLVTASLGALQAVGLVAASARLAGAMGALTTATVLCLPLELHFERLNLCNVWTTATWSLAFAVAVLAGARTWAGIVIGVLLAAGWYGYQSSRLVPLIVGAPLLVLLGRAPRRYLPAIGLGVLSFFATVSPLLYGFWLEPDKLTARAFDSSWLSRGGATDTLSVHLSATLAAFTGGDWDHSAFLPYHVVLFPLVVSLMAVAGLAVTRSLPLTLCLGAWIGVAVVGNFVRNVPIYSCVLVCAVPAFAVAAGLTARVLGVAAPLLAGLVVFPATSAYFQMARSVPPSASLPMAHYRALQGIPHDAPLLIGGGLPCSHGFNQLYKTCIDLTDARPPRPPGAYAVLFGSKRSLAKWIPGERQRENWDGIDVLVIRPLEISAPRALSAGEGPTRAYRNAHSA